MLPSSTSVPSPWTIVALLLQMRRFVTFCWNHLPVRCVGTPIAPGSSVNASSDTHTHSCAPLVALTVSNQYATRLKPPLATLFDLSVLYGTGRAYHPLWSIWRGTSRSYTRRYLANSSVGTWFSGPRVFENTGTVWLVVLAFPAALTPFTVRSKTLLRWSPV